MRYARTSALSHVNAYELMCARVCRHTYFNSPTSTPPPSFFIQCITLPSKILWQCAPCRHEITSQKFFKGRTGAQTSEGSRIEPKLIHYMCCICLLLKSPERSLSPSLSLSNLSLQVQTTSRLLFMDLSKNPPALLAPLAPRHSPSPRLTRLTSPGLTDELAHKVNTRFTLGSRTFI